MRGAGKAVLAAVLVLAAIAGGFLLAYRPAGEASEGDRAVAEAAAALPARLEVDDGILEGMEVVTLGPEDASIYIYFFYDLYCPYCAMEVTESADYLAQLASRYKLVLVDFIVHEQGLEGHALLRCAARQGAPVLGVLATWYSKLVAGERPGIDALRQILSDYGYTPDDACVGEQASKAMEVSRLSSMLGVRGTPTIAIYDAENGIVLNAAMGYMSEDRLREFIESSVPGAR